MFQVKFVEQNQTHFLCSMTFFRKSSRLWDNVEKYGREGQATGDKIILRIRFACRVTNATDTHSEYVILIPLNDSGVYMNAPPYYIETYIASS
jgi:hypothetical protein